MQLLEMYKKKQWSNMVQLKLKLFYIHIPLAQFIYLLEKSFRIVLFQLQGKRSRRPAASMLATYLVTNIWLSPIWYHH